MNKLQCPLCRQAFNQPNMCPHCSQVYCYQCIRSYLNKYYFCPSCDRHVIDLVDCSRLINEVKQKIKESDHKRNNQIVSVNTALCSQHSLPLKYHCLTCKTDICSDCGLISQKHKNHVIQPIQMVKPTKNTITPTQLKQIKFKLSQKLQNSRQQHKRFILQLQLLKSQIKYNKTKIYEYYEQLVLRLNKQAQINLKQIQTNIHKCAKNINERIKIKQKIQNVQKKSIFSYQKIQQNLSMSLEQIISSSASIQIIDKQLYSYLLDNKYIKTKDQQNNQKKEKKSKRLRSIIQKQQDYDLQRERKSERGSQNSESFTHTSLFFDKKIYQLSTMKQIYPDYHNFSFQIDYKLQKDEDIIYSPNFKVYGFEWRFKIYPKGNAQSYAQYLSVFLQLVNSPQALTTNYLKQYFFRLQLLNLNQAGKSVIKESQCWGYAQFIPLSQIKDYIHDSKLLFVMGVKNISYFDLCQNMKKYIEKLEGQTKILTQLCGNYLTNNNNNLHDNLSNQIGNNSSTSSQNGLQLFIEPYQNSQYVDELSSIISSVEGD